MIAGNPEVVKYLVSKNALINLASRVSVNTNVKDLYLDGPTALNMANKLYQTSIHSNNSNLNLPAIIKILNLAKSIGALYNGSHYGFSPIMIEEAFIPIMLDRLKNNLISNGFVGNNYQKLYYIIEEQFKPILPKALVDDLIKIVQYWQEQCLTFETILISCHHNIGITPFYKLVEGSRNINMWGNDDDKKKTIEFYSNLYPGLKGLIDKFSEGTITNDEKIILIQELRNKAGHYFATVKVDQLVKDMLTINEKANEIQEVVKNIKNISLPKDANKVFNEAYDKVKEALNNPVTNTLYENIKYLQTENTDLHIRLEKQKEEHSILEKKFSNFEKMFSSFTEKFSTRNENEIVVMGDEIIEEYN